MGRGPRTECEAARKDALMGCAGFPDIAPTEAERLVADKAGIKPGPRSNTPKGKQIGKFV